MFKRIRQMKISLAAKCQLLFGGAVVLIILAALVWPWLRMEQLMEQVNVAAAETMGEAALARHVMDGSLPQNLPPPTTQPTTQPAAATATTHPTTQSVAAEMDQPRIRLVGANHTQALTGFDQHTLDTFRASPDTERISRYYDRKGGGTGYRLALPMFATQDCLSCHTAATDQPAIKVGDLMGVMTVDITSRIEYSDLLENRFFFLTAGVLAGTLALVVFYLIITRLILQPVRVLQETAEKVSEGDLDIRSDISTGDEFQQLSETFNTMLSNLKESADQLRAINKTLDTKLGQLAETNVALYESNRLKSEFLANVSHELRTPLNSILGFTELLKESTTADAKSARYIQNITQSGKNLLELINDLLDLAKIEAGKMEVRSERLSLSDMFEGLSGILKPLLAAKDLTVETEVMPDVPILQTDPAKLQQVLYNFMSNAIKFSPRESRIDLRAERNGEDQVKISVSDHGPGIEKDKQAVIFEKFRQLDASVTRQYSGTGLGLAISKELTALLGGTIGVSSSAGEGATFWISLPLKIAASSQDVRGKMSLT